MYLLQSGLVKLYAENDQPFATFRNFSSFGDNDLFIDQKRNGTAKALDYTVLYQIRKKDFDEILEDYPSTKRFLIQEAIEKSEILAQRRLAIIQKYPIFGLASK